MSWLLHVWKIKPSANNKKEFFLSASISFPTKGRGGGRCCFQALFHCAWQSKVEPGQQDWCFVLVMVRRSVWLPSCTWKDEREGSSCKIQAGMKLTFAFSIFCLWCFQIDKSVSTLFFTLKKYSLLWSCLLKLEWKKIPEEKNICFLRII